MSAAPPPTSQARASLAAAAAAAGRGRASSTDMGGVGLPRMLALTALGERRSSTPATAAASPTGAVATHPSTDLASSSAASSQMASASGPSRADQIVYRFYLKTVGVLVDGRVTHLGGLGERKNDRWFNITIPDTDVHKGDLAIYRAISSYPPSADAPPGEGSSRSTVPPLLIAFILDTNDIPAGQTLMWNRDGARLALDPCRVQSPANGAKRPGIVLERWTFRVTNVAAGVSSGSQMAPPTAYRLGIVHFRALYAFIRLLPAYRLFRRLRRLNTGLRLGIKLWGPEGYANTSAGLAEAWSVMERDLVGVNVPLERMAGDDEVAAAETCEQYDFAPLELFGNTYDLGVSYRPNVDFDVEDMESVLSERFVDMDEEWFTPTVARHRLEAARAAASAGSTSAATSQPVSRPASQIPPTPPPLQQAGISMGASRQVLPTTPKEPSSLGAGKWGALTDGLPFASGSQMADSNSSPTSACPNAIPYRRLSAHSLQPFRSISASPSTSILRAPGPVGLPSPIGRTIPREPSATASPLPGSLPRMSEFLSSSGRSFSHAQMANMAAASPPIMAGLGGSPPFAAGAGSGGPGLNFPKQAVPPSLAFSTSSPFVASSLDKDSPSQSPQSARRLSLTRRLPSSPAEAASMRRTGTRESGLRHSIDEPRADAPDAPDKDDVHAFLRTLDSWTPPATIALHGQSPRTTTSYTSAATAPHVTTSAPTPRQTSATSSLSANSQPSPSITGGGPGERQPLTRQHVDDMLKRMVGSFSASASPGPGSVHSSRPSSHLTSRRDSLGSDREAGSAGVASGIGAGLLSASRPSTSPRALPGSPLSGTSPWQLGVSPRSATNPLPGSSLRHAAGSLPRTRSSLTAMDTPEAHARSLPDGAPPGTGSTPPATLRTLSPLSPQTTGGTSDMRRRGPVLVRGGFNPPPSSKGSTSSSSPSHSPVRDIMRPRPTPGSTNNAANPSFNSAASSLRRSPSGLTTAIGVPPMTYTRRVGRTAPSSLGADVSEDSEPDEPVRRGHGITASTRRGGRVASEGSTSPADVHARNGRSARSPVAEGLMARLALAEQQARERRDDYGP